MKMKTLEPPRNFQHRLNRSRRWLFVIVITLCLIPSTTRADGVGDILSLFHTITSTLQGPIGGALSEMRKVSRAVVLDAFNLGHQAGVARPGCADKRSRLIDHGQRPDDLLTKIVHCGAHLPHFAQRSSNRTLESAGDGMKERQNVSHSVSSRSRGNQAQGDQYHE